MRRYLLALIILALLVMAFGAGCNGERVSIEPRDELTVFQTQRDGENEPAGALTLDPPPEAGAMTATPTPGATDVELPAGAEALVTLAQQDLARRLDLAPEVIRAVSIEAAEWPDASLGCPQPGEMYAQVVTPGFRVVLEAEGKTYEYHTDLSSAVWCAEPVQAQDLGGETSWVSPESGQLPIFVEVLQIYLLSGAALETSPTNVPPNDVFAFDPASQTLLLRPSIVVSPETQVLVGQTTVIRSRTQSLARGELFQVPLSSTGPVEVIAVDTEAGTLTLAYGDQTFELLPGQSRSFKQTDDQAAIHITIVTNSGRLASIGSLPGGPDAR